MKTIILIALVFPTTLFCFACLGAIEEHRHFKFAKRCQDAAFKHELTHQEDAAHPNVVGEQCYLTIWKGWNARVSGIDEENVLLKAGAW